ncbi:MAG: hypothetical protein D6744_04010 [Planctomycetota bacterium]|nr:MAG: hypothetical protein D6744_04010 [Planctomycetota bacterium]
MRKNRAIVGGVAVAAASVLSLAGCPTAGLEQLINTAADAVNRTIDNLQETDIRSLLGPTGAHGAGLDVELIDEVEVITNPEVDLRDFNEKDGTLLAFENNTAFNMFVRYVVDGHPQSVFVFAGETSVLKYPCVRRVVLLAEWDFDPQTEEFVGGYDLRGGRLENEPGEDEEFDEFGDVDCPDPNDFFFDDEHPDSHDVDDPNAIDDRSGSDEGNDGVGDDRDPNSAQNAPATSDPSGAPDSTEPDAAGDPCRDALDIDLPRDGRKEFTHRPEGFDCGDLIVIRINAASIEIGSRVPVDQRE